MTITTYNCACGHDYVNKNPYLTQIAQYSGTVRESVDIVRPEILVNANIISENYCYIDTFASFYYIEEKSIVRDGITRLVLQRDPFMTELSDIMSSPCICERSGQKYDGGFPDNEYHFYQKNDVQIIALPTLDVPNTDSIIIGFVE